ncbi:MAG: WPE palindromic element domain-containing protein [Wolbachia sp.]
MSSRCTDYLDPENLTLNKWLHNKGWIPVLRTIIYYVTSCHITTSVQLYVKHWNDIKFLTKLRSCYHNHIET